MGEVGRSGAAKKTPINLARGWPNPGLLPVAQLAHASALAFANPEIRTTAESALEYGPDEGYAPLRRSLAEWLTGFYEPREPVVEERICVTGGASQGLASLLLTFTDPAVTRAVWMVAPTYFCACRIFDDAGFAGRMRAVPEDDEGLDVGALERGLEAMDDGEEGQGQGQRGAGCLPGGETKSPRRGRKIYRHVFYAVPTFANPSGKVMSLARREALVRLARKHDALVMADDVYDMLQWSVAPAGEGQGEPRYPEKAGWPRVVDVDRYLDGGPVTAYGNAVSNGSFSKIAGPGNRTGWVEATEEFAFGLSQTGQSRSGGCASQLTASFMHNLLETSLPQYIRTVLQPAYARRYHALMSAIKEELVPLGVVVPAPDKSGIAGGYFVWLTLPGGIDAELVARKASDEEMLNLPPGSTFQVNGDTQESQNVFRNDFRLCFAWVEEELLTEGIKRLASVIRRVQNDQ